MKIFQPLPMSPLPAGVTENHRQKERRCCQADLVPEANWDTAQQHVKLIRRYNRQAHQLLISQAYGRNAQSAAEPWCFVSCTCPSAERQRKNIIGEMSWSTNLSNAYACSPNPVQALCNDPCPTRTLKRIPACKGKKTRWLASCSIGRRRLCGDPRSDTFGDQSMLLSHI
jgi:hypothetical protein